MHSLPIKKVLRKRGVVIEAVGPAPLHPDARDALKKLEQKLKRGPKLNPTDFVTPEMGRC